MDLPERFKQEMHDLFIRQGREAEEASFFAGFDEEWKRAWRLKPGRLGPAEAAEIMAAEFQDEGAEASDFLQAVPWTRDGFYIPKGARPGLSLLYRLGLIYIQEASAMLPAECLQARPGEMVLDLCAAPGGKSSQILSALGGEGLLIANDISESRARVLQRNIEQQALEPSLVISADPERDFPPDWDGIFDAVQLDAPCSGEGMFRRDPGAAASWERYGPESISEVQKKLLDKASALLKPGGRLVYSTCTFNLRENEEMVASFLDRHDDFEIIDAPARLLNMPGLRRGIVPEGSPHALDKALRIWPQDGFGEGHFAAVLRKKGPAPEPPIYPRAAWPDKAPKARGRQKGGRRPDVDFAEAEAAFLSFLELNFKDGSAYYERMKERFCLRLHKNWLYLLPSSSPDFRGVKVLKSGIFLGELKRQKNAYVLVPSQAWLLTLDPSELKKVLELEEGSEALKTVLGGQTLVLSEKEAEALAREDGDYTALTVLGFALAWGRQSGRTVKNLYPKGWVRG